MKSKCIPLVLFIIFCSLSYSQTNNLDNLIKNLASDKLKDRILAALSLKALGQQAEPAIPALINNLGHRHFKVRHAVAGALANIGSKSIPLLIITLNNKNNNAQIMAAKVLKTFGKKASKAIPHLIPLLNSENPQILSATIEALGAIGVREQKIIGRLAKLLAHSNQQVRSKSAQVLGDVGSQSITMVSMALQSNNLREREAAVIALTLIAHKDKKAISVLAKFLKDRDLYYELQEAFIKIGAIALPELIMVLKDKNKRVRTKTALIIEQIMLQTKQSDLQKVISKSMVPVFIQSLQDKEKTVRFVAVWGLKLLGKKAKLAIPALTTTLEDSCEKVRVLAISALVNMEVPIPLVEEKIKQLARYSDSWESWAFNSMETHFRELRLESTKDPRLRLAKAIIVLRKHLASINAHFAKLNLVINKIQPQSPTILEDVREGVKKLENRRRFLQQQIQNSQAVLLTQETKQLSMAYKRLKEIIAYQPERDIFVKIYCCNRDLERNRYFVQPDFYIGSWYSVLLEDIRAIEKILESPNIYSKNFSFGHHLHYLKSRLRQIKTYGDNISEQAEKLMLGMYSEDIKRWLLENKQRKKSEKLVGVFLKEKKIEIYIKNQQAQLFIAIQTLQAEVNKNSVSTRTIEQINDIIRVINDKCITNYQTFSLGVQEFRNSSLKIPQVMGRVNGRTIFKKAILGRFRLQTQINREFIYSSFEDAIILEVIRQNTKEIKCTNKDYIYETRLQEAPMYQDYCNWGLKNKSLFIKDLLEVLTKTIHKKDIQASKRLNELKEYKNLLESIYQHEEYSTEDHNTLVRIWEFIKTTPITHNLVRKFVFKNANMTFGFFKRRVKITARLDIYAKKSISEEMIKEFSNKEEFALSGGTVKIKNISVLLADPGTQDPIDEGIQELGREKIVEIQQKLKPDLRNFSEVAMEMSEDYKTKYTGGDMGWIPRWGSQRQELANCAYHLPLRTLSKIINAQFGFHIIVVMEKKPPRRKLNKKELLERAFDRLVMQKKEELLKEWLAKAKIERFFVYDKPK